MSRPSDSDCEYEQDFDDHSDEEETFPVWSATPAPTRAPAFGGATITVPVTTASAQRLVHDGNVDYIVTKANNVALRTPSVPAQSQPQFVAQARAAVKSRSPPRRALTSPPPAFASLPSMLSVDHAREAGWNPAPFIAPTIPENKLHLRAMPAVDPRQSAWTVQPPRKLPPAPNVLLHKPKSLINTRMSDTVMKTRELRRRSCIKPKSAASIGAKAKTSAASSRPRNEESKEQVSERSSSSVASAASKRRA